MRRVYMFFTRCYCEDFRIRPTKRSFQSFVSHNGKDNYMIIEDRFPSDAKVVDVIYIPSMEIFYILIESEEYPDVQVPTEINPAVTTLDTNKERVQFT